MILRHIFTIFLLKIISVSCKEYGSLAFVIDDTFSMYSEINTVRGATDTIMDIVLNNKNTQIKDIVLVTFNDPQYLTELRVAGTRNKNEIIQALKRNVYGGGDCPEYSFTGMKKALDNSYENSYLLVFTDASPKEIYDYIDGDLFQNKQKELKETAKVIKLAQARGSQIFVFITPSSCEDEMFFKPYYQIAAGTNGQVFKVNDKKDVEKFIDFWKILISGEANVFTRIDDIPPNTKTYVPFTVDDQTEYVLVSASTPGGSLELDITKGPTRSYKPVVWNENNKVLRIDNPLVGDYEASVVGSSYTTITIVGRTDFTFQHGFAETVPPTFRNDRKQPTEGTKYHLLISVTDPTNSVDIQAVEIKKAGQDTLLHPLLPLRRIGNTNFYTTELFLAPNSMFSITVVGKGKRTHQTIRRTAKTPIEPRPRDSDPKISIEGGGTYEYNSEISLLCKVTAYPKPDIIWKDEMKNIIPSTVTNKGSVYYHVSQIKVKNLRHRAAYYCYAKNDVGENSERVDLDVTSPFTVDDNKEKGKVVVDLGNKVILYCNIKSKSDMKIQWYQSIDTSLKPLTNSLEYRISDDGTQLEISKVSPGNEGKYICLASLLGDDKTQHKLVREIEIKHVAPVMGASEVIKVKENESTTIKCTVEKAYPDPKIRWEFRETGSNNIRHLREDGVVLNINSAKLNAAGVYTCIAENDKGSSKHETNVIVLTEPKITLLTNNKDVTEEVVEYGTNILLTCHIVSHVSPVVIWRNKNNEVLKRHNPNFDMKPYQFTSQLQIPELKRNERYYCEAANEVAKKSKVVNIKVISPFKVEPTRITSVEYESRVSVKCGITCSKPFTTSWYRGTNIVENSKDYSISEDRTVLSIKKVKLNTQGKYVCQASIIGDEETLAKHETTVQISGLEMPQIEKQATQNIFRDQTAVLKCKILKGHPKPTRIWLAKIGNQNQYTVLPENGEQLVISKATYNETGKYKCVATNIMGNASQTVELNVQGPPVILSNEDILYRAIVGDVALRIPCVVVGYPTPVISWMTGSNVLSSPKYSIQADGSLVINKPVENDSQKYKCVASNKYGSTYKLFEAVVSENIENLEDIDDNIYIDILEGNSKTLNCQNGSLKGRWFKEGEPLNKIGDLSFINANMDHDGNYTCEFNDNFQSEFHNYIVEVGSPPYLEDPNEKSIDWDGSDELLICDVLSMKPKERTAKAEWFYNGRSIKKTKDELINTRHPIIGWGNFTCKISNVHGQVTKNFYVYSSGCLIPNDRKIIKSPLVLNADGTWPPLSDTERYYHVKSGKSLLFSCHNQLTKSNGFQKYPTKTEIIAICDHESKFRTNEKTYTLDEFECRADVTPLIRETGQKCLMENTELVEVGFDVKTPQPYFLKVYEVCIDQSMKVPLYTKVKVQHINRINIEAEWKQYKDYNEKNMKYCVEGSQCCLARDQLVNELDVMHGPAQTATFINGLNTVSNWHGCSEITDNWAEVSTAMRASKYIPLDLWSGAHAYSIKNGRMVPRYLWKRRSGSSIVVVKVNDPSPKPEDIKCHADCPFDIPEDTYTYCCELAQFEKEFASIFT